MSAITDKFHDVLGRAGFQLTDPSLTHAVMRLMVAMGKPTFRLVASLERIGYRPTVMDRSVLQYGDNAAVAFGWVSVISRLGQQHRRWVWCEPHRTIEPGDRYHNNAKLAACHDWLRLRRAGVITRLVLH